MRQNKAAAMHRGRRAGGPAAWHACGRRRAGGRTSATSASVQSLYSHFSVGFSALQQREATDQGRKGRAEKYVMGHAERWLAKQYGWIIEDGASIRLYKGLAAKLYLYFFRHVSSQTMGGCFGPIPVVQISANYLNR
jgi:hypothetical protein